MSQQAQHQFTNRLVDETSPYLLQHAHNPVDWYAWGPDAFAAARAQDKPIFLSVGYSTCYWCHVMERQSFENEAVAKEMNSRFINIKVDREERPDVDSFYMTAVQVLARQGGWPMSVFLTPDLRPFYGGTYFPPGDGHGRPGFVSLLRGIDDAWKNRREDVLKSAEQLENILRQVAAPPAVERAVTIDEARIDRLIRDSASDYDPQNGGFGGAPKFPRETLLELLLDYLAHTPDEKLLAKVTHTLDAMALGGIRDHLGGGFHRYSTDAEWLVPHFEIMLYDQAMLAQVYTEAFRQTENRRYANVARGVFDFVLREMTSPDGAFYTALDAEVDAMEGGSYLWTEADVHAALTDEPNKGMGAPFSNADADVFCRVYGLSQGPNFADPHNGSGVPETNILYLDSFPDDTMEARLAPMRRWLKQIRDSRKQPMLDTKIITSWNALMIRALAIGGEVLAEPRYVAAAANAANFLLQHHRTPTGTLLRTSRDGKAKHDGFLDDYAFFAQSLLAIYESDGRDSWKEAAAAIATDMLQNFGDTADGTTRGFFFTSASATDLFVRQKVAGDSPLPGGNAVAAMVMQDLGHAHITRDTIATFAAQIDQIGEGMNSMVQAAAKYLRSHGPIKVVPDSSPMTAAAPVIRPQDVVQISTRWASSTDLRVDVQIAAGYHVNAHEPLKGLVPTQLSVTDTEVVAIDYPKPVVETLAFSDEPVPAYSDRFTIAVRLAKPPASTLRLSLQYQACSDSACLPAVTKQVSVSPESGE